MYLVLWILALLDKRRVLDMFDPYVAAVFKYLIVFCLIPSPNLAVRFFVGAAYATSSLLTVIYLFRIHHGLLFRYIFSGFFWVIASYGVYFFHRFGGYGLLF